MIRVAMLFCAVVALTLAAIGPAKGQCQYTTPGAAQFTVTKTFVPVQAAPPVYAAPQANFGVSCHGCGQAAKFSQTTFYTVPQANFAPVYNGGFQNQRSFRNRGFAPQQTFYQSSQFAQAGPGFAPPRQTGGGGLGQLLSPQVLGPAVGAAAGAAVFPGAAPLGAAAGSALGSILFGGR